MLILIRSLKCGEVWDQTENVGFEEGSLAGSWDDELKIAQSLGRWLSRKYCTGRTGAIR